MKRVAPSCKRWTGPRNWSQEITESSQKRIPKSPMGNCASTSSPPHRHVRRKQLGNQTGVEENILVEKNGQIGAKGQNKHTIDVDTVIFAIGDTIDDITRLADLQK